MTIYSLPAGDPDPWAEQPPEWPPPDHDQGHAAADAPSWAPVDLSGILAGTWHPPQPAMLTRSDGVSLLYPGLTHSFHGESESGKSLVAQYLTAQLIGQGLPVAYLDYESDPGSVVDRLLMFGATRDQVSANFTYVQPEASPHANSAEAHAWLDLTRRTLALVVLDGVTASLVASRMESKDNDQVTRWSREIPEHLAHRTGAAVVMIDHVPKDSQTRGRFAIGAQAKLGRITGAAFMLEPKRTLGQGLDGVVSIRIAKDRPGQVRRHGGPMRWTDRTQEVARFVLDSTGATPRTSVEPPDRHPDEGRPFRPTAIMEKVSRHLETSTAPCTKSQIEQNIPGKAQATRAALDLLVAEGYVTQTPGPRSSLRHASAKPYRQASDPQSDAFTGQADLPADQGDADTTT
jgi:hypothetical protein